MGREPTGRTEDAADEGGVAGRRASRGGSTAEAVDADTEDPGELLRALVEGCGEAIVGLDARSRVTQWNAAAQRLFGWRSDEALGRPLPSLLPASAPDPLEPALERALAGQVVTEDSRRRRKDGQVVEASFTLAPLRDGRRGIRGVALVARDATERRRLEGELVQAQKMEAVGRLSSGIAHDFRNLLMAIGGCCDLATRNLHNPAIARQYVEEARAATERGARLTDQLLTFGRKQTNKRELAHVGEVLSASEGMLRRLIGEDVTLRIRRDPDEPPVGADPSQIEQVVMNLVVNARDAMPGGGDIHLETRVVTREGGPALPADVRPGRFVELSVQDTGVGMSATTRANVFEPFFTTKAVGEGTGLGLTTVYAAAKQAGGFVEVDSAEGKGTTFRVCMRAVGRAAPVSAPSKAAPMATAGRVRATVLLSEDDALVRLTVRHYLELNGHRVLEAVDAKDAMAIADAEGEAIEVLVTDMVMPSMSGRELARYLLARSPDLRVVYMSAHPLATLEAQGRLEPGMPVLQKPFGAETLQAAVEAALARE